MYTFSFIVGNIIPNSVQCIHSATKGAPEPSFCLIRAGAGAQVGSLIIFIVHNGPQNPILIIKDPILLLRAQGFKSKVSGIIVEGLGL